MKEDKKVSIEELKKAVGGYDYQWKELKEIVLGNPKLKKMYDEYLANPYFEDDDERIAEILYNIWEIPTGWGPDDPIDYEYGMYNHEQIKEMLRNYK